MNFRMRLSMLWFRISRHLNRLPVPVRRFLFLLLLIPLALLAFVGLALFIAVGFLRGLWFRLFPPPVTRDISRMSDDLDAVSETIADEGKPLKPDQLRLITRDPRLLPKAKPPANVWPRPKRKKVMTAAEAARLFAGTLRSRNRQLNDLRADTAQLKRWKLPQWNTEEELAAALGVDVSTLRHFSIHRHRDRCCHYVTFRIPKRNGRSRLIMAPKRRLKEMQRKLNELLVNQLPVSDQAHGFRTGRSIRTGTEPHIGKALLLKMDLQDFFPTVTFPRVRGYLIAAGYSYPIATTLAVLMTEAPRQPVEIDGQVFQVPVGPRHCVQGAPTSPGLCNAICVKLDQRLAGLGRSYGWSYTRYADDLTFSTADPAALKAIKQVARQICREEGFEVNDSKTVIARKGRRQTVTGVTVNEVAGLSRTERRKLRAAIHRLKQADPNRPATLTREQLAGKLAYLKMLNPAQATPLQSRLS